MSYLKINAFTDISFIEIISVSDCLFNQYCIKGDSLAVY